MSHDDLTTYRDRFPILEQSTYLVSHSLGAMPSDVHGALEEYATTWQTRGIRAWAEGWWDLPARMGDGIALEPQKFPDTPNRPAFGSAVVAPGKPYRHAMIYRVRTMGSEVAE